MTPIGMSNVNEPRAQEQSSSSFHCGLNSNCTIDTSSVHNDIMITAAAGVPLERYFPA
jgi:hypothetical protein